MKTFGYLSQIQDNHYAIEVFQMLMVLPLLPAHRIKEGFLEVKRYAAINNINLHRLFSYYDRYLNKIE